MADNFNDVKEELIVDVPENDVCFIDVQNQVKVEIDANHHQNYNDFVDVVQYLQLNNAEQDTPQTINKSYECYICAATFNDQKPMKSHMNARHGFQNKSRNVRRSECFATKKIRRKVNCDVCGLLMCTSRRSRHMKKVHMKNDSYYCSMCEAHFKHLPLLVEHIKSDHLSYQPAHTTATLQYTCHLCKRYFKTQTNVDRHIKYCHATINEGSPAKMTCIDCGKMFQHEAGLMRHVDCSHFGKIYRGNLVTPCEVCGKVFANSANKRRHVKIIHEGIKAHVCTMCDKRFGQATELQDHIDRHNDNRVYECDVCLKKFRAKCDLKIHVRTHSTNSTNSTNSTRTSKHYRRKVIRICEICGRSMEYNALYGHMRTHSGVKSFECKICSKKFLHKPNLVAHIRIHNEDRPFKCDLCPRTFRQYGHIREHRKTHTGEKPYACTHCGKTFAGLSNMKEHERIHTGETPYQCNLCSERFGNLKALRRHAKSLHPDEEDKAVTVKPKQYTAERWRL